MAFDFNAPVFSPGGQEVLDAQLLGRAAGDHVVAVDGGLAFFGGFLNDQGQLSRAGQAELGGGDVPGDEGALDPASALDALGLGQAIKLGLPCGFLRGKYPPAGGFGRF